MTGNKHKGINKLILKRKKQLKLKLNWLKSKNKMNDNDDQFNNRMDDFSSIVRNSNYLDF